MTTSKRDQLILELDQAMGALTIEEAMAITVITRVMAHEVEPTKPSQARLFMALHDLALDQVER